VEVSREERDLADVRCLDETADPAFQADREPPWGGMPRRKASTYDAYGA
jgi:hypothetical protein